MKTLFDTNTSKTLIDPATKKVLTAVGSRSVWGLDSYGALNNNVSTAADTYDIVVDGDGNIYVAGKRNSSGKTVFKYDSNWNLLWSTGTGTGAYSSGIAVDSSGNVYVVGVRQSSKSLWQYDSLGTFVNSMDTGGSTSRIVISSDNIYVAGDRNNTIGGAYQSAWSYNSSLGLRWAKDIGISTRDVAILGSYVYFCGSPSGSKNIWKRYASNGNAVTSFLTGGNLYCIDVDLSDNIYVGGDLGSWGPVNAWALNSSGTVIWSYNTFSAYLFDIKVDSDGWVYLAGYTDRNRKTVWKVKGVSAAEEKLWGYNTKSVPWDIAVDKAGNAYVAGDRVQDGAWANVWKITNGVLAWKADTAPGGLATDIAQGIAVDCSTGDVYVAGKRYDNKNLWQFHNNGSAGWTADTTGANTYKTAVDSSGNVYVTGDTVGATNLWKYSSTGELLQSITTDADCDRTYAITIDADGKIYVSGDYLDEVSGMVTKTTIWKLNNAGGILWSYVIDGIDYRTNGIWDIAVNKSGVHIVISIGSIRKLDHDGNLIWSLDTEELIYPTGIVVDSAGDFYVSFDLSVAYLLAKSIWKLDSSGRWIWFYHMRYYASYSIAIDYAGNIYVTGDHTGDSDDTVEKLQFTHERAWAYATAAVYNVDNFAQAIAIGSEGKVYMAGKFCSSEI